MSSTKRIKKVINKNQKVVFFGCGSVGKCCVHYFKKFFKCEYNQLYIVDKDPKAFKFPTVEEAIDKGVNKIIFEVTKSNIKTFFNDFLKLKKYDIIIDLTTNTETYNVYKICRILNLLYINTSIEEEAVHGRDNLCPTNDGIFLQHVNLRAIADKTRSDDIKEVTTLIEFGMNPGLISVFVKSGILDIARMVLKHQTKLGRKHVNKELLNYYNKKNHKKLAKILKIRTIHCSEIDTQIPLNLPKEKFFNTWSCVGLITEGVEPAEIQIGTHEKVLPFSEDNVNQVIPQLIVTKTPGKDIKFKSLVPSHIENSRVKFTNIVGRCVHHGEGISLNRFIGNFDYSPTMHYVYQLNPLTEKMMSDYSSNELLDISEDKNQWKVLNMYDNNIRGYDNVGALFIMEENPITNDSSSPYCFWTGSILNSEYTRNVLKDDYFGPTVIQVMAGVLAGVSWMLGNKHKGLVFGEDLDDDFILKLAKKYLGKFYSGPVSGVSLSGITLEELIVEGADQTRTLVDDL